MADVGPIVPCRRCNRLTTGPPLPPRGAPNFPEALPSLAPRPSDAGRRGRCHRNTASPAVAAIGSDLDDHRGREPARRRPPAAYATALGGQRAAIGSGQADSADAAGSRVVRSASQRTARHAGSRSGSVGSRTSSPPADDDDRRVTVGGDRAGTGIQSPSGRALMSIDRLDVARSLFTAQGACPADAAAVGRRRHRIGERRRRCPPSGRW